MQLLDAVNEILPKLGERPVTSLDAKSPTLGVILPQIASETDLLLQAGWWFNTRYNVDLFPDSEGNIAVPDDTLSFVPADSMTFDVVVRGTQFWRSDTGDYSFTEKITGTLIQRVAFEELPESAARFVLYSAMVTCYATDIGLESVVQLWQKYALGAQSLMEQDHLRHRKYSVKQTRQYRRLRRAMRG
jgi:hypothetical protein